MRERLREGKRRRERLRDWKRRRERLREGKRRRERLREGKRRRERQEGRGKEDGVCVWGGGGVEVGREEGERKINTFSGKFFEVAEKSSPHNAVKCKH